MARCHCARSMQEYKCIETKCKNYGQIYCQDCVNDHQDHIHKAFKYHKCRDDEMQKWLPLYQKVDKIYQYCDPIIQSTARLTQYLETIASDLGIATKYKIMGEFDQLKRLRDELNIVNDPGHWAFYYYEADDID